MTNYGTRIGPTLESRGWMRRRARSKGHRACCCGWRGSVPDYGLYDLGTGLGHVAMLAAELVGVDGRDRH